MRCKPGDIAIVVNDLENPANNGGLVEVICRADPARYRLLVDWECRALSNIRAADCLGNHYHVKPGDDDFAYRDCELKPLPPLDFCESELEHVLEIIAATA